MGTATYLILYIDTTGSEGTSTSVAYVSADSEQAAIDKVLSWEVESAEVLPIVSGMVGTEERQEAREWYLGQR